MADIGRALQVVLCLVITGEQVLISSAAKVKLTELFGDAEGHLCASVRLHPRKGRHGAVTEGGGVGQLLP